MATPNQSKILGDDIDQERITEAQEPGAAWRGPRQGIPPK